MKVMMLMYLPYIDWLSPIISCNLITSINPSHTLSEPVYIYYPDIAYYIPQYVKDRPYVLLW